MAELSVLIPAYNEVKTIAAVIEKVNKVPISKEVIIIDDHSSDGTRELLKKNFSNTEGVKIIYLERNLGKGAAIKTALGQARGTYTIIQDADLEYDPNEYMVLFSTAEREGVEAVYGSRFLKTWKVTHWWHYIANNFLTTITNILYGSRLSDMQTCYKLIKTDVLKSLDLKSDRFEIEPEITVKLLKRGCLIREVPISYKGRSYREGKKIGWKDGFTALWVLVKYKFVSRRRL